MSLNSKMCMADMGTLFLGSSILMADPFGPLLDEDEERALSERSSSPLSFSSYSESFSSPFSSPSAHDLVGCKVGCDVSLPWLSADEQIDTYVGADQKEGDTFSGMDWMSEKIDLADFDLDSLIGSCDLDEPPSSPEELLASLESQMDLVMAPFSSATHSVPEELNLPPLPLELPLSESEVHLEPAHTEIKSEPESPAPPSPAFTLELGSEVDIPISEIEKAVAETSSSEHQIPSIVLSLSSAQIVVVIAPKEELSFVSSSDQSDSGVDSPCGTPPRVPSPAPSLKPTCTSRTKPYSKPVLDTAMPVGKVKSVSGNSKGVDKKVKKMEQNKTAATRYRQKKRVEQEVLNTECAELENRNKELSEKADSLSREIQYLKDLIEEVRSAKNRKNKAKADSP
ncbi:cyclic AMP-dependent transcription factor ATF-4 [Trichomycterus rosablanca]|uniref:cyclic AMP-dependent transcription factor ATF-4 n=1 Tax=Trichomycterus rosablanca TaxID=2290929 RepID=UPI002F3521B9